MNKRTILALLFVCTFLTSPMVAQRTIEVDKTILKIYEERSIPSRSAGTIVESFITEGAIIDHPFVLIRLDDAKQKLDVERLTQELDIAGKQAESKVEVNYAEKSIAVAKSDLERALESNARYPGLVSETEVDRLRLIVDRAEAEKKKAVFNQDVAAMQEKVKQIDLKKSQLDLEYRKVVSPMKGRIDEVFKRVGEWVETSEPVAKMVRLDVLKVEMKVPAEVGRLDLKGTKTRFSPKAKWLKGKTYDGEVCFVEADVNPVDSSVRIWLLIQNPQLELRPGMEGKAEIILPVDSR